MKFNKTEENLNNFRCPITLYIYSSWDCTTHLRIQSGQSATSSQRIPEMSYEPTQAAKKYLVLEGSSNQHVEESRGLVWERFQDADTGVIRPLDKLHVWKVTVDKVHRQDDPALPS